MFDDQHAYNQVQELRAQLSTCRQAMEATTRRVRDFKAAFGVRERNDGAIVIEYDVFVAALGRDAWLELRAIGDEKWRVSGEAGEKPRVRVAS